MSRQSRSGIEHARDLKAIKRNLIGCFVIFCTVSLLGVFGFFESSDRAVYDAALRVRVKYSPLDASPRIIPVDLNDRAERNLGERIDTREAFLQLFKVLGDGAISGGMDFLFAGSKNETIDDAMADAVSGMESLVLAAVPLDESTSRFSGNLLDAEDSELLRRQLWHPVVKRAGSIPVAITWLLPNRDLLRNSCNIGHIGVASDSDGIYRKSPLFYRYEDGYIPSFALALAAANFGIDTSHVVIDAGREVRLPLEDGSLVVIPIDITGSSWIPYPSDWFSGWKRIPMDTISNSARNESDEGEMIEALTGGILVVADTTTAKKDFGVTPFENVYPLSGIHTSVLNGIITGIFFRSPRLAETLVLMILLFAGCLFSSMRRRDWLFHASYAALCCGLLFCAAIGWFFLNIVPAFTILFVALAVSWLVGFGGRLFDSYQKRTLLESALSRYFPKALAARIISENKTDLRPSLKEITILFADIAGFTKWSSDKAPETVHGFLSDYLESMAEIIHRNEGSVDKFMGDGILAFFGDPFDQPDHASRALRTAFEMQRIVRELNDKWQPLVGVDLQIRIGVNTGPAIVGNLGTRTRIEYTVIGAAVNLASRMESNAPVGGIMVTAAVLDSAGQEFPVAEKRELSVKGYDEKIIGFVVSHESVCR